MSCNFPFFLYFFIIYNKTRNKRNEFSAVEQLTVKRVFFCNILFGSFSSGHKKLVCRAPGDKEGEIYNNSNSKTVTEADRSKEQFVPLPRPPPPIS